MGRLAAIPFGRAWLALLGITFSVVALWIALRNVDLAFVVDRIGRADGRLLLAVVVVGAAQVLIRTVRWRLLLPIRADERRVGIRRLLPVLLIGYLGNVALPARLGEMVRTYLVSRREGLDPAAVLGTVALERILDVVALSGFAFIVAAAIGAPAWILSAAALTTVLGVIALAVATAGLPTLDRLVRGRPGLARWQSRWLRLPGLRAVTQLASRFISGVGGMHDRRTIGIASLLSLAAWPLDALLVWLIAASIDIDLSLGAAALVSAAAVLSTAVPSAPGYVGTYELAAASAAQAMGVGASPAFALAVLAHAFTVLPAAIAGAVCLVLMRGSLGAVLPAPEPDAPTSAGSHDAA